MDSLATVDSLTLDSLATVDSVAVSLLLATDVAAEVFSKAEFVADFVA